VPSNYLEVLNYWRATEIERYIPYAFGGFCTFFRKGLPVMYDCFYLSKALYQNKKALTRALQYFDALKKSAVKPKISGDLDLSAVPNWNHPKCIIIPKRFRS
jgi:hypothetical protein